MHTDVAFFKNSLLKQDSNNKERIGRGNGGTSMCLICTKYSRCLSYTEGQSILLDRFLQQQPTSCFALLYLLILKPTICRALLYLAKLQPTISCALLVIL
jgi:hypothetical protein